VGDTRRALSIAIGLLAITAITATGWRAPDAAAATLPDGRGYELASPELNNASISPVEGTALADGSGVQFPTVDAPVNAQNGTVINTVVARRGPDGWTTEGVTPKVVEPIKSFFGTFTNFVSPRDLGPSVATSDQNLTPDANPPTPGSNLYYRSPGGTSYKAITRVGYTEGSSPYVEWESSDFTHVYFEPIVAQLPEDPLALLNTYEWTTEGDLRLIGVLPGPIPTLAPNGAVLAVPSTNERPPLAPVSGDGGMVLWREFVNVLIGSGPLYLREHAQRTVEITASQRTVEPDPNPPAEPTPVGVTEDGTAAYFTSSSELTNDAYTGRAGGVANDAGPNLYRYDVASGELTDLTVDTKPADAATGANVTQVIGATQDGSFIFFTATGDLAAGATSGAENLYVEHNGKIEFIVSGAAIGMLDNFYVTPDGRHAAFLSRASLTGYDNHNPVTGTAEPEAFLYSQGGGLKCVSCRPDGEPPTGEASFARRSGGIGSNLPSYLPRTVSDDGSRVFFQSTDAVLPGATNDLQNVYEYEGGQVHLISPGTGTTSSTLLDASASGDDVFFVTHDELVPTGLGRVSALYDARVGATSSNLLPLAECTGEGCRGTSASAPHSATPGSTVTRFNPSIAIYGKRIVKGDRALLAISVPASGRLKVSGKGLRSLNRKPGAPGVVRVSIPLLPKANRSRQSRGSFSTNARVVFQTDSGASRQMTVGLQFLSNAKKKGGK
jgi:hypothetical protein